MLLHDHNWLVGLSGPRGNVSQHRLSPAWIYFLSRIDHSGAGDITKWDYQKMGLSEKELRMATGLMNVGIAETTIKTYKLAIKMIEEVEKTT